jgi:hypothetical protein
VDTIYQFFNQATDFFNQLLDFRDSGIYEFFTKAFAEFTIIFMIDLIEFKIYLISFFYDVVIEIFNQLKISDAVSVAWSYLSPQVASIATFFHIPDVVNIILSARMTKFLLRFFGF